MSKIIDVDTGDVKFGTSESILRSVAIGSCIAIAAYNRQNKTCAMAHVMLPGRAPENSPYPTRYTEDAVDKLLELLNGSALDSSDIEACIVGAGNVLQKEDDTICDSNIKSVNQALKKRNIPVRASSLGGTIRRSIAMDVETGKVCFSEGGGQEKELWKPA